MESIPHDGHLEPTYIEAEPERAPLPTIHGSYCSALLRQSHPPLAPGRFRPISIKPAGERPRPYPMGELPLFQGKLDATDRDFILASLLTGGTSGWMHFRENRALIIWRGDKIERYYRILGHLGKGGRGSVWEAREKVSDKGVAIKQAHDKTDKSRLSREYRALGKIEGDGDLYFYAGADDPALVMPLMHGDLKSALDSGRFSRKQRLHLLAAIWREIARLHKLQVAHRDVKLENFLIEEMEDGTIRVKLADVEDASWEEGGKLESSQIAGTKTLMKYVECRAMEEEGGDKLRMAMAMDILAGALDSYLLVGGGPPKRLDAQGFSYGIAGCTQRQFEEEMGRSAAAKELWKVLNETRRLKFEARQEPGLATRIADRIEAIVASFPKEESSPGAASSSSAAG